MNEQKTDYYMGVPFKVEARASVDGQTFVGEYTLLGASPLGDGAASMPPVSGVADIAHPSLDRAWATENEALNAATEAAHHAIELVLMGRTQGQGNHSAASARRIVGN